MPIRFARAWNAFSKKDDALGVFPGEASYGGRPYGAPTRVGNGRHITSSLYNRIALDAAKVRVNHVRVDENGRYIETLKTGLNDCVSLAANMDQTSPAFMQNTVMSLFDEGVIAIVPVDTTRNPTNSEAYDIHSLRAGKITAWLPDRVKVDLYNDRIGRHQEIILPKNSVAIVENPFYSVMNEQNSTLKRLISKLNLLDVVDEASSSGKLDIIIQLPYMLKSAARKAKADERRAELEEQLTGSTYGIGYTDATEKIIQLNRPSENNLMAQIEYLTAMLYSQLGLTESVMDGTADEKTMLNYQTRTVGPVTDAIVEAMGRSFISKTGRTQGQRLMTFNDTFKLVPVAELAEAADKFTRNAILSSNEVRSIIGFKPSNDPKAEELSNKNMPTEDEKPIDEVESEEQEGGKPVDEA